MRLLLNLLVLVSAILRADEIFFSLGDVGSIRYIFSDQRLVQIDRLSLSNEILYTHQYQYDDYGNLISERMIKDLGIIEYNKNLVIKTPYSLEICEYDENHNLTKHIQDGIENEYTYNEQNQLTNTNKNLDDCRYDLNGNLVQKGDLYFFYDKTNRLKEISSNEYSITCAYDPAGRRISKTVNGETETYFYFGINEIAILDQNNCVKALRIPGLSPNPNILRPIAIETPDAIYAPIHDIQGNIVKLIDVSTKEVISLTPPGPFGETLSKDAPIPWIFSGKHYDKDIDLVYFGSRYYSPQLNQWITPDPAHQALDLYQYCLNNPFSYVDPDGEFAVSLLQITWGVGATITAPIWSTYALAAIGGAALGYGGYKAYQYWQGEKNQDLHYDWDDFTYERLDWLDKAESRSFRPDPDPRAEGRPHTIIERPGADGQYTTHNGNGTFKQYRGSGKPHGDISRPNVKENELHNSPDGPVPGRSTVRPAKPEEIPEG